NRAPSRTPGGGTKMIPNGALGAETGARASAETGAMPVRIELPQGGIQLEHARYWIEAGRPVRVWTSYLRGWLAAPLGLLLAILAVGAAYFAARTGATRTARLAGTGGALIAAWPLSALAS